MASSASFALYHYTPTLVGAVLFAALFFLTTAAHLYQRIRGHAKYFNPFIVGGIFQIIGYGARIVSHFNETSTIAYAVQNLFLLLAPILYAASIYMVLGRIITFLRGENLSFVPVKLMTKIFVGGDVLSFILQAADKRISYDLHGIFKTLIAILFAGGGVMTSGSRSSLEIGQWVIVAGLCVQLIFFGAFVLSALVFHYNITRTPTSESERTMSPAKLSWSRDWRGPLLACYIVSVLIVIRSIYRLVEFVQGNDGFVISHELFLYVFDAAMMFIAMVVMNLFHPSAVLHGGLGALRTQE